MADVKIKSVSKADLPNGQKEKIQSGFSVYDGFKFGIGLFLAFLTGFLVLSILTALVWYLVRMQ